MTVSKSNYAKDWNERVLIDPYLWMAEFVSSPQELRESGERDLNFLLKALPTPLSTDKLATAKLLDLGCGIGRLSLLAADHVHSVLGADISERALAIAEVYTETKSNISFTLLNGNGLSTISGPFDIVISFATLPHLTAQLLMIYLTDIHNLLEVNGVALLQLYTGDEHQFQESDTFSLRSYTEQKLLDTLGAIGFTDAQLFPLELPFDGVDRIYNRHPVLVRVHRSKSAPAAAPHVSTLISGDDAETSQTSGQGPRDEEGLLLREVNNHLAQHNLKDAHKLLKYLISSTKEPPFEVIEAFEKIEEALEEDD